MAYDNSNVKPPIIDLLYPSEEQRRACLKRKAQIEQLPTEFEKRFNVIATVGTADPA